MDREREFNVDCDNHDRPGEVTFTTPRWVEKAVEQHCKISKPHDKTPCRMFSSEIVNRVINQCLNTSLVKLGFIGVVRKSFLKVASTSLMSIGVSYVQLSVAFRDQIPTRCS